MVPQILGWPLVDFFADALRSIFSGLMQPLLMILQVIMSVLIDIIFALIVDTLILWLHVLLKLVDFCENIFNVFSGVEAVRYDGENMYLLDVFFTHDTIRQVFLTVTLIGVALSFIFTIYSVIKSMGSSIMEDKKPIAQVLKQALKTSVTFMLVPLMCYFGLQLSTAIVATLESSVNSAMGTGGSVPYSTILFLSGTYGNDDVPESTRTDYMSGDKSIYDVKAITDFHMSEYNADFIGAIGSETTVKKESDYLSSGGDTEYTYSSEGADMDAKYVSSGAAYNFLLVYVEAIFTIIIMLCSIFLFIRRIFEVLILYITAPLYVSTMPLDEGETFRRWRDMFIGKLISGFGVVFTMKITTIIIPAIVTGKVFFVDGGMIDAVLKMVFCIGSLFAAYKSQHTLLEVISPEVAMAAKESTGALIALGKTAASLAVGAATGGASVAGQAAAKGAAAAGQAAAKGAAQGAGNAFKGASAAGKMNPGGAAKAGGSGPNGGPSGGGSGGTGSAGGEAKKRPPVPDRPPPKPPTKSAGGTGGTGSTGGEAKSRPPVPDRPPPKPPTKSAGGTGGTGSAGGEAKSRPPVPDRAPPPPPTKSAGGTGGTGSTGGEAKSRPPVPDRAPPPPPTKSAGGSNAAQISDSGSGGIDFEKIKDTADTVKSVLPSETPEGEEQQNKV